MGKTGGQNKTHGRTESAERIDSFETMLYETENPGRLRTSTGRLLDFWRDVVYYPEDEREYITLAASDGLDGFEPERLAVSRIPSGYGGTRTFWRCPRCGWRYRYLYYDKTVEGFRCRRCAGLNYQSQQTTHDFAYWRRRALAYARGAFEWEPEGELRNDPECFCKATPPRPKGMHRETYKRRLRRLRRYQTLCEDAFYQAVAAYFPPDWLDVVAREQVDG